MPFHICRRQRAPRKYRFTKTRRETLHLRFDPLRHVLSPSVWHVAIRPRRVLTGRSAACVEQTRLRQQHKWPVRHRSLKRSALRSANFIERASQMHCSRLRAFTRCPGNRPAQRPIELEHPRSVTILLQLPPIALGQPPARDLEKLPRRHIAQHNTTFFHFIERTDSMIRHDRTAE